MKLIKGTGYRPIINLTSSTCILPTIRNKVGNRLLAQMQYLLIEYYRAGGQNPVYFSCKLTSYTIPIVQFDSRDVNEVNVC